MTSAARLERCQPPRSAFVGFRFPAEVIVVAVRGYLRYGLSYRDVEGLLAERGIEVEHVTGLPVGAAVRGRNYGLPQQSWASDVLAEAFLDKIERALIRRGLQVSRYNDDFRFACSSFPQRGRAAPYAADQPVKLGGIGLMASE